jgi:hypothetical protein
MKKVLLLVVGVVCIGSYAFAQSSQSLQLAASSTQRALIAAPPTLPVGTTTFTLPEQSSILISNTNTEDYNWILGGNSAPMTSNLLGTLTATDLIFVTGTGGPNTRMTISGTTGGVTINGDLDAINGATGYNWPTTHAPGYLQNNGTGGLSWQSSLQASRAGLGNWFTNNYGTGVLAMPVSGTTILTAIVSPFGGGLSGVSILVTPPGGNVGGALTATVTKNGAATLLTVTLPGGAGPFAFTDFSATPVAFNAGDQIGVTVTDGANTFAPNVDILVTVFANF